MKGTPLLSVFASIGVLITSASARELKVEEKNGLTRVFWDGAEVWRGVARGRVQARQSEDNGRAICAAWDGETVLWESRKGAASVLKAARA